MRLDKSYNSSACELDDEVKRNESADQCRCRTRTDDMWALSDRLGWFISAMNHCDTTTRAEK